MKQYCIITANDCMLYQKAGEMPEVNTSTVVDEIFSGWQVTADMDSISNGWIYVKTHYGYYGYMSAYELEPINSKKALTMWQDDSLGIIRVSIADILEAPTVTARVITSLLKNSIVKIIEKNTDGWTKLLTAAGQYGYVHSVFLTAFNKYDDMDITPAGVWDKRQAIVWSARKYLGVQYRWGGKSSQGIDCSGLAFMSYMENGIIIYRDAQIVKGCAIEPIPVERLDVGDLIFFPGHVAIYLGGCRYIHATAHKDCACVTINSLNPRHGDYRADLADNILGYGSAFACKI